MRLPRSADNEDVTQGHSHGRAIDPSEDETEGSFGQGFKGVEDDVAGLGMRWGSSTPDQAEDADVPEDQIRRRIGTDAVDDDDDVEGHIQVRGRG